MLPRIVIIRLVLATIFWVVVMHPGAFANSRPATEPVITTEALMKLRELNGLNGTDGLIVSPDGRWAFVLEQTQDISSNIVRFEWLLLDLESDTSEPERFEAGDNVVGKDGGALKYGSFNLQPPLWSSSSEWFVFVRQDGENVVFTRGNATVGGELERIAAYPGEVASATLTSDDRTISFSVRKTPTQLDRMFAQERDSGYLFDHRFIPRISKKPLSDKPVRSRISPDSVANTIQLSLSLEDGTVQITPERATGQLAESAKTNIPNNLNPLRSEVAVSEAGYLAWRESLDPDKQGFRAPSTIIASTPTRKRVICHFPECTSDYFNLRGAAHLARPDDERILFSRREGIGGRDLVVYEWRPVEGSIDKFLSTTNTLENCRTANGKWICFESGPKDPRRVVSIDLLTGRHRVVYEPNPDFPALENVDISYLSIDLDGSLAATAIVASQKGSPGPLVITSYNCLGFLKGGTGDEYPIFPLVAHGFSVMCFNDPPLLEVAERIEIVADYVRIGAGPGLPKWQRSHEALGRAIELVETQGLAVSEKRAITGLSAGAQLALFDIERRPYDAAIVSSAPSFELAELLGGAYQHGVFEVWGMGERFFDEIRVDPQEVSAALLINVAEEEFLTSIPTYDDFERAGKPVDMYVYAGEAHVKNRPHHRRAIYDRNIQWLKFWLRNEEVDNPVMPGQYDRWREMRKGP